jgi:hypothetical protein
MANNSVYRRIIHRRENNLEHYNIAQALSEMAARAPFRPAIIFRQA